VKHLYLVTLLGVAGCSKEPARAVGTEARALVPGTDLQVSDIEAAEYSLQFVEQTVGPFRFSERKWADPPNQTTVHLIKTLTGDLDGDHKGDGVAVIAANFGGTGTFVSVFPVLNRDGKALPGRGAPLGDRTQVEQISLKGDTVVVGLIAAGPSDPACCPSDSVTQRFHLVGDSLALLP